MPTSIASIPNLVYQLLFLVPGYLTYFLAVRIGRMSSTQDRFDKLMLSLLSSGTSIGILYIGYLGYLFFFTPGEFSPPSPFNFSWAQLTIGFLFHVLLTVLIGVLIGNIINIRRDEWVEWIHPWLSLHQDIQGTPTVNVVLKDKTEINGKLVGYERANNSQDLRITDVGPQNSTVYIYGTTISHLCFLSGLSDGE